MLPIDGGFGMDGYLVTPYGNLKLLLHIPMNHPDREDYIDNYISQPLNIPEPNKYIRNIP